MRLEVPTFEFDGRVDADLPMAPGSPVRGERAFGFLMGFRGDRIRAAPAAESAAAEAEAEEAAAAGKAAATAESASSRVPVHVHPRLPLSAAAAAAAVYLSSSYTRNHPLPFLGEPY